MARSTDDTHFLHSVPQELLEAFRDETYTTLYIQRNPLKFIDTNWVDIPGLKEFLARNASDSLPTRVKMEPDANATQLLTIKKEPNVCIDLSESASASQVRTRTVVENGTEIIEILSDSEDEVMDELADWAMDVSSDTLVATPGSVYSDDESESFDEDALSSETSSVIDTSDLELDLEVSATQWLDPEIESHVSDHPRRLNRQLLVERVEYLSDIPTYWPVPRQRTAYILDLRGPKFDVYNEKGEILSVDALIKNKDQDSWTGMTGAGDSKPTFDIFTGQPIPCRRSHLECVGFHACSHVNPKLLNVEHYELDPESLEEVLTLMCLVFYMMILF